MPFLVTSNNHLFQRLGTLCCSALVTLLILALNGCFFAENENQCERCHVGLELASESHTECVDCHGGDVTETDMKKAHASMHGPRNPSAPEFWDKTCGKCHAYQLERVRSNLMYTNTGFIKNIQLTWEGRTINCTLPPPRSCMMLKAIR